MIELKLINKSYGNQKILDKISLNIIIPHITLSRWN